MMHLGQMVQNVETGEFAVYAGFRMPNPFVFFTPERVVGGNWTHVEDCNGQIDIGEFVSHAGTGGCFFGELDPDKLDESDWAAIREICARPAQPVRTH